MKRAYPFAVRDNEDGKEDKPERRHAMKSSLMKALLISFALLFAACGGSAGTETASEEGLLITGTLYTEASAMLVKDATDSGSCIGEVCAMVAYNADGSESQGELDPAENRFRIRVRAGNWMFGFEDGAGNRLGYLAMNGITALTVEDGDEVELGRTRLRKGQAANDDDAVELYSNGIYSYYGRDDDKDGIPAPFDADEPSFDPDLFGVLFLRPHDGQPNVAPCRPVKIVFTKPIDDESVSADTIKVVLSDDTPVSGEFSIWEDAEYGEYEVVFAPAGGYPMGGLIGVTIISGPNGVLSDEGEVLAEDVKASFEVRDFGSASQTCHDPDLERQRTRTQEREQERDGEGGGSGNSVNERGRIDEG